MADIESREHSSGALDSVALRVQAACTSGYTGVVRVTVVGDIGYWYFRRGTVIHSTTLDLTGEEAALDMLSWHSGQWEPCSRPWPAEQSIFISWVELFQRAGEQQRGAAAHAETASESATNEFATSESATSEVAPPESETQQRRQQPWPFALAHNKPARSEPPVLSSSQIESLAALATHLVAIDHNGKTHAMHGDSDSLSELTSYALLQCDHIAALLGDERCQVLEVGYRAHTLLVAYNVTSTVGLMIPSDANLDRVKTKLRI